MGKERILRWLKPAGATVPGFALLLLMVLAPKGQAVDGQSVLSPQIAHAQSPVLAISKSASPDPVVAGGKLTYVITITNTQSTALTGIVVVWDMVPEHATFSSLNSHDGQWIMRSPGGGKRGEVSWEATEPLLPDQTAHLEMVVQVEEGWAGPIVNADYGVTIEGVDEPVVGQPVTAHVVQPTPTVTPTPMPTATPMPPTATLIPIATPTPRPATSTPTPSPTPVPPSRSPGNQMGLFLGTVSIVAVLVPVVAWFVKSKGTR